WTRPLYLQCPVFPTVGLVCFYSHTPPPYFPTLSLHDALPIYMESHNFQVSQNLSQDFSQWYERRIAGRQGLDAPSPLAVVMTPRSEEHTSELQSRRDLVCRLLLEKKKKRDNNYHHTA